MTQKQIHKNWREVELSEIAWFQEGPGVRQYQFTKEGVKLLNVRNLVNGNLFLENTTNFISSEEANGKYKHFLVDEGDIIMASSGVTWGKTAVVKKSHLPLCMNTSTIRFKVKDNKRVIKEFLLIFLNSTYFKNQVGILITGSAQPNFGPSHLKQIKIPLPPLETQKAIVSILEKAETLKQKREESNKLTQEYLQSVFYEMFLRKDFEEVEIAKGILKIKNKNPKSDSPEDYFLYLDIASIDNNVKKIIGTQNILGKNAPSRAKQLIKFKDVLVSTVRPNLKAVAMVPKELDNQICSTGYCVLRADNKIFIPEYLFFISQSSFFVDALVKKTRGANYPAVSNKDILSIKIPLPPLELQQKFASIVENVEKLKEKQRQSKKEINEIFNSLMQKAFNGELVV